VCFAECFGGLIKPLGVTFHALFAIAVPTPVGSCPSSVCTIIYRFRSVSFSPALCPISLFSFGRWRVCRYGLGLVPRVDFASASTNASAIVNLGIFVSGQNLRRFRQTVARGITVVFPQWLLLISKIATHAAMETLSTLSSKTLAGFNSTPPLGI
jgi:hypothetical protein